MSSKLRKSARGQPCQIRIPDHCNHDRDTVVLCHLPGGGMGLKQNDLFAAFGCMNCHMIVDSAIPTHWPRDTILGWHKDGVFRTQQIWLDMGLIKI